LLRLAEHCLGPSGNFSMTTIQEVLSKRFITSRLWPPRFQF